MPTPPKIKALCSIADWRLFIQPFECIWIEFESHLFPSGTSLQQEFGTILSENPTWAQSVAPIIPQHCN